jgi:hypothetical protein
VVIYLVSGLIAVIYCRFCLSNKIGKNYSCHRFNNRNRTNHKDHDVLYLSFRLYFLYYLKILVLHNGGNGFKRDLWNIHTITDSPLNTYRLVLVVPSALYKSLCSLPLHLAPENPLPNSKPLQHLWTTLLYQVLHEVVENRLAQSDWYILYYTAYRSSHRISLFVSYFMNVFLHDNRRFFIRAPYRIISV